MKKVQFEISVLFLSLKKCSKPNLHICTRVIDLIGFTIVTTAKPTFINPKQLNNFVSRRSAEARVAQGWNCQRRMWRFAFIFNTTSNKHALVPKKWIQVSYILHIPPAACHQLAPAALCINVHVAGCSLVHPSRTNQVYRESNFLPAALGAVRYPTKYGSVKSINEHATSAAFQRLCAIVISRLLKRIWDIERLASLLYANV